MRSFSMWPTSGSVYTVYTSGRCVCNYELKKTHMDTKATHRDVKQSWQPKHRLFNAHHWHIKGWLYGCLWMFMVLFVIICSDGGNIPRVKAKHRSIQRNPRKAEKYIHIYTQNQRNPKQRDHTRPPSQPMETTGPDMRNQGKCHTCHSAKKHEDLYNFNHNSFQRGNELN